MDEWDALIAEMDAEEAAADTEWNRRALPLGSLNQSVAEYLGVPGCYRTLPKGNSDNIKYRAPQGTYFEDD